MTWRRIRDGEQGLGRKIDVQRSTLLLQLGLRQRGGLAYRLPDVVKLRFGPAGTRKPEELVDDRVEAPDFLPDPLQNPVSFTGVFGILSRGSEEFETPQRVPNLVSYPRQHEAQLVVTVPNPVSHAVHGPSQLADLVLSFQIERAVHGTALNP